MPEMITCVARGLNRIEEVLLLARRKKHNPQILKFF